MTGVQTCALPISYRCATVLFVRGHDCGGTCDTCRAPRFLAEYAERTRGLSYVSPGHCRKCATCDTCDRHPRESCECFDEGFFSKSPCDTCGDTLHGKRYPAHGFRGKTRPRGRPVHLDVCDDCLQYVANGTVPGEC